MSTIRKWLAKGIYTDWGLFRGHRRLMAAWWVMGLSSVCLLWAALIAESETLGLCGVLLLFLFLVMWENRVARYVRSHEGQRDGADDTSARFRSG